MNGMIDYNCHCRINIEVLSVVAQQITSILNAMATLKSDIENVLRSKTNITREEAYAVIDKRYLSKKFTFQGQDIDLVWSCGLFITMNPGWFDLCLVKLFVSNCSCLCQAMLAARNCRTI
jgi:acyl-ACP thioesterase